MKVITGNLWDYLDKPQHVICITTNGDLTTRNTAIMGAGCAKEAADRFPDLPRIVGAHLATNGNVPVMLYHYPMPKLIIFPVKHHWYQKADPGLIQRSASWLRIWANETPSFTYVLPRPGCGNGKLQWRDVKKVLTPILPDNVVVISP